VIGYARWEARADRLKKTKRDFVELVPDLMVEIKSKSDRIKPLEEKIRPLAKLFYGIVEGFVA
jgi:Uma2 family endonuclease